MNATLNVYKRKLQHNFLTLFVNSNISSIMACMYFMLVMTFFLGTTEKARSCFRYDLCHINTSFDVLHKTVVENMSYSAVVNTCSHLVVGTYCRLVDNDHT